MTLTDTQAAPWMNGWTAPQAGATPADPAAETERLRGERDAARAERDRVIADFESFKAQVATVGEQAARRHGSCGAYDAILNELGLSRPVAGSPARSRRHSGSPAPPLMSSGRCPTGLFGTASSLRTWNWPNGSTTTSEDVDITIDRDLVVISEVTMAEDS